MTESGGHKNSTSAANHALAAPAPGRSRWRMQTTSATSSPQSSKRRRLTFQLTPLLDLLLIVIFAQYMEVQQTAESAQQDLQQQKAEIERQLVEQQAQLEQSLAKRTQQLEQSVAKRTQELEQRFAAQQSELAVTRENYSEHYESILRQHHQAGSALAEALNLPGGLMEQVLALKTNGQPADADNLQAAVERMKQLLQARGPEMLQFILRYDEMQKHVSVWEVHLQSNGQALFSDAEQTHLISFATMNEFISRAFEASKSFTEPKPLVIILLSWGDTQAGQRRRTVEGMPGLIEQLRTDSGNSRWFDFSLMGFRPTGPLLKTADGKEPAVEAP